MAHADSRMTAHGVSGESCSGCGRAFRRGEQMTGYVYEDNEPAGWHCADCEAKYKLWGTFDPDRAAAEVK